MMIFPARVVVALGVLNAAWGVYQDEKIWKKAPWLKVPQSEVVDVEQFPWQVAIIADDSFFCAGSLFTQKWVLTTANCVLNRQSFQVAIGSTQDVRQATQKVILHPNYTPGSQENDLALLGLPNVVPLSRNVGIVNLPPSDISVDGKNLLLTGWSSLEDKLAIWADVSSPPLKSIAVRGAPDSSCIATYGQSFSTNKICIDTTSSPYDEGVLTLADGGSPIVMWYSKEKYVLVGVLSSGPGHTTLRLPVIATKLSRYVGWIQEVTNKNASEE